MQQIPTILSNIAQAKQVKILYACETGSRAWGFPSPDSDYDVRFIYIHERDWYLSLHQTKDSIEVMDGELDITGWDLKKCLMLLKRSNAPLIERLQSPVVYQAVDGFEIAFRQLISHYYSPTAVFYHHHSLAKRFWEELQHQDQYKLKSLFYLVRSLLSCNWIMENNSVLPMDIYGLMQYATEPQQKKLEQLIALKATVGEAYLHPRDSTLEGWIVEWFYKTEANKDKLLVNKNDMTALNEYFLKQLYATHS